MDIVSPPEDERGSSSLLDPKVLEENIRARIIHTLWIYPKLSPSMLQVGIGTGLSPALWHPVLNAMVTEDILNKRQVKAQNPVTGRDQVYTIIEPTEVTTTVE